MYDDGFDLKLIRHSVFCRYPADSYLNELT